MNHFLDLHVLAVETQEGIILNEIPESAWKRLSPTLSYAWFIRGLVKYHVKAGRWVDEGKVSEAVTDLWESDRISIL